MVSKTGVLYYDSAKHSLLRAGTVGTSNTNYTTIISFSRTHMGNRKNLQQLTRTRPEDGAQQTAKREKERALVGCSALKATGAAAAVPNSSDCCIQQYIACVRTTAI